MSLNFSSPPGGTSVFPSLLHTAAFKAQNGSATFFSLSKKEETLRKDEVNNSILIWQITRLHFTSSVAHKLA